jgi:hypothetical protein
MGLGQQLGRSQVRHSLSEGSHVNPEGNAKEKRRVWRARNAVSVATAVRQCASHRAKIKATNSQFAG